MAFQKDYCPNCGYKRGPNGQCACIQEEVPAPAPPRPAQAGQGTGVYPVSRGPSKGPIAPCPVCGYRTCTCSHPANAGVGTTAPNPWHTKENDEATDDEMIEHLEEVWQEMDRGRMNSGTVEFLETMKNAVQRALAKRTREEEEDPNHRIYRGPPRS